MRVAVGCPVKNRAWVLRPWFEAVDEAFRTVDLEPEFFFVCGSSSDGTEPLLGELLAGRPGQIIWTDEDPAPLSRSWNLQRYREMVDLRNALLEVVRRSAPDFFLSLDSDILIHNEVLGNLIESSERFDAVGGKVYLSPPPSRSSPSYAMLRGTTGSMNRKDFWGVAKVDAIMAVKLMNPAAYGVDYRPNFHGEDLGWSQHCRESGLVLGFDGRIASKHVMSENWLTQVDPRVGY